MHVVVSALFSNVDCLISGDGDLHKHKYDDLVVLRPGEFIAKYSK